MTNTKLGFALEGADTFEFRADAPESDAIRGNGSEVDGFYEGWPVRGALGEGSPERDAFYEGWPMRGVIDEDLPAQEESGLGIMQSVEPVLDVA